MSGRVWGTRSFLKVFQDNHVIFSLKRGPFKQEKKQYKIERFQPKRRDPPIKGAPCSVARICGRIKRKKSLLGMRSLACRSIISGEQLRASLPPLDWRNDFLNVSLRRTRVSSTPRMVNEIQRRSGATVEGKNEKKNSPIFHLPRHHLHYRR